MLIDVGVNLLNRQFREDSEAVLTRAANAGVSGMLITATDLETATRALALCRTPDRFCTAGVHPHDAADVAKDWLEQLTVLAENPMVRAVGETGLDFNRNFSPAAAQLEIFQRQITLARQIGKPLFVHDRDSDGEVLRQLQRAAQQLGALPPTVIHCFTGNGDELQSYLEAGFYIGITGWIADPRRGAALRALVAAIPLDRLLLETDAPFLRPHNAPADFLSKHGVPSKRKRRNEPALLPFVLDAVTECRPETRAEILAATAANARTLFGFA